MNRETQARIVEQLLEIAKSGAPGMVEHDFRIPVERYTSRARFEAERDALFRRYPLAIAHASEVARPGDFVTWSHLGVPLVVARDAAGELRAFLNVCRHRGTRLANEACGSGKKAFVCPYHQWTYDLTGALIHVPQEVGFPSVDRAAFGLVPVPVESRFGFIWVRPSRAESGPPMDIGSYLGALGEDLEDLGMARHVIFRRVTDIKRTNWKLVMDAFLESYHIRTLHRNSVYPFFLDNVAVADVFAPHIRAAVARKGLLEAEGRGPEEWNYRQIVSGAYFLFPNTILVIHPDYISQIGLLPLDAGTTHYTHTMLIPEEPSTDRKRMHWERSFELIENGVFQQEDLATAESIQAGLSSGANEALLFGRFEHTVKTFHDFVDEALAGAGGKIEGTAES